MRVAFFASLSLVLLGSLLWTYFGLRALVNWADYATLGIAALLTTMLAVLGYRETFNRPDCYSAEIPYFSHAYYAVRLLFGEHYEGCATTVPTIQFARLMALAVLTFLAVRVLLEVTQRQWTNTRAVFANKVVLLAGLNENSLPCIQQMAANYPRTLIVLLERDLEHPLLGQVSRCGIRVLPGDITNNPRDLKRLRRTIRRWPFSKKVALRAAYLLDDNDYTNMLRAEILEQQLGKFPHDSGHVGPPPRIIVRIDRYRHARFYTAEQVKDWDQAKEEMESAQDGDSQPQISTEGGDSLRPRAFKATVGLTQLTAQALAQRILEVGRPERTIVVGNSDLADAFRHEWHFQHEIARKMTGYLTGGKEDEPNTGQGPDKDQELNTGQEKEEVRKRRSLLEKVSKIKPPVFVDDVPSRDQLTLWRNSPGRTAILLTGDPDEYDLSDLERRTQCLADSEVQMFVPRAGMRGIAEIPVMGRLYFYGPTLGGGNPQEVRNAADIDSSAYTPSPLVGIVQDSWLRAARIINDSYLSTDFVKTWAETNEEDRENTLRSLWNTLSLFSGPDCRWVSEGPGTEITDGKLDFLAPKEHDSWCKFRRAKNWALGSEKDVRTLTNPLLILWKDLSGNPDNQLKHEEVKRRTREALRRNIEVLGALGYRPQLVQSKPQPTAAKNGQGAAEASPAAEAENTTRSEAAES
ncbi:hypothetical protein [Tessaracoccus sp. OH4464_COT-324]|uniref:hypothetical protein n=1 Tax=Tessaracoccus sp. OH4464_COT-324 TaxID=2491059 RepID=UPI000F643DDA|nr:hypothetical protein [Tessaracoccus sp. OH4464_COT-324]RRD47266.1 hypothetical protein EII42_03120 [Tessaracoccus sp. OH4464_COT-324]